MFNSLKQSLKCKHVCNVYIAHQSDVQSFYRYISRLRFNLITHTVRWNIWIFEMLKILLWTNDSATGPNVNIFQCNNKKYVQSDVIYVQCMYVTILPKNLPSKIFRMLEKTIAFYLLRLSINQHQILVVKIIFTLNNFSITNSML